MPGRGHPGRDLRIAHEGMTANTHPAARREHDQPFEHSEAELSLGRLGGRPVNTPFGGRLVELGADDLLPRCQIELVARQLDAHPPANRIGHLAQGPVKPVGPEPIPGRDAPDVFGSSHRGARGVEG